MLKRTGLVALAVALVMAGALATGGVGEQAVEGRGLRNCQMERVSRFFK